GAPGPFERSKTCPLSETGGKQGGKPPGTSSQTLPLSQAGSVSVEQKQAGSPVGPARQTPPFSQAILPSIEHTTPSSLPPQFGAITTSSARSAMPPRILPHSLAADPRFLVM